MRVRYASALALVAMLPTLAQTPKPNSAADWPMYNRDQAGTRYSPLTQIDTNNVPNLKVAWSYRLSDPQAARGAPARGAAPAVQEQAQGGGGGRGGGRGGAAAPTANPEATPIVVNNVMYLPAGGRVLA